MNEWVVPGMSIESCVEACNLICSKSHHKNHYDLPRDPLPDWLHLSSVCLSVRTTRLVPVVQQSTPRAAVSNARFARAVLVCLFYSARWFRRCFGFACQLFSPIGRGKSIPLPFYSKRHMSLDRYKAHKFLGEKPCRYPAVVCLIRDPRRESVLASDLSRM